MRFLQVNICPVNSLLGVMCKKNIFVTDIFEFCFGYALRNVETIKEGLELNETHHILICVDDINFSVENINTSESFLLQFAIENCY